MRLTFSVSIRKQELDYSQSSNWTFFSSVLWFVLFACDSLGPPSGCLNFRTIFSSEQAYTPRKMNSNAFFEGHFSPDIIKSASFLVGSTHCSYIGWTVPWNCCITDSAVLPLSFTSLVILRANLVSALDSTKKLISSKRRKAGDARINIPSMITTCVGSTLIVLEVRLWVEKS